MIKMSKYKLIPLFFLLLIGCKSGKQPIPKPPTYLKIALPENNSKLYQDECRFSFEKPAYFEVQKVDGSCNRDIHFSSLNGTLHLSVIDMEAALAAYVDYAIDKVEEHKIKATAILDTSFVNSENSVFGTFFELKGNVATPFQFYLTDSTDRFVAGVVYFNTRPNYDSIRPVLNFVKDDLYQMMESWRWESK
jgi:gliding motility-associated lipoprotein GldD